MRNCIRELVNVPEDPAQCTHTKTPGWNVCIILSRSCYEMDADGK